MSKVSRLYLVFYLLISAVGLIFAVRLLIMQFPAHYERVEHHRPFVAQYRSATVAPSSPSYGTSIYFSTRFPGSALPTEAQCASQVRPAGEVRTDNDTANHTVPSAAQEQQIQSASWNGSGYGPVGGPEDGYLHRVTGNFTGTTDQILQWAACKWGIDENVVRAQASNESWWHQNNQGDWTSTQAYCPPGTWTGSGCYQSYGILQIKYHWVPFTWPMSRDETAFVADYTYAVWRMCYEGQVAYLQGRNGYAPGDVWGCIGFWYSGQWHDAGATTYIGQVQGYLSSKPWLTWPGWSSEVPVPGEVGTPVPSTPVPPTSVPPTAIPPTAVPPTAVPPTAIPPTSVPPSTQSPVPSATATHVVPQATATLRPCPTVPSTHGEREPDGDSDDRPYLTATATAKLGCR